MIAIDNAKNAIQDDNFLPPYDENLNNYTNESILKALKRVENKIISDNIPF
jgi:hypothetical protein